MIRIEQYSKGNMDLWNEFVSRSKNGTFLFDRRYMDYHADRFKDFSLMIYNDRDLVGLLPANIRENVLFSHEGLTYGGIICGTKMKTSLMLEIFENLKFFLKKKNLRKVIYKTVPHIYHTIPAEEDVYALFRNKAVRYRVDVSSSIILENAVPFNKGKRASVSKAKREGVQVKSSNDISAFFDILNETLAQKYGTCSTHTVQEMQKLMSFFPRNILFYGAYIEGQLLAGTIIYISDTTVHTQYMGSSDEGKSLGALELIIRTIIDTYLDSHKNFDFGISTENKGQFLNTGLVAQKEMYGARAVCYNHYEWNL